MLSCSMKELFQLNSFNFLTGRIQRKLCCDLPEGLISCSLVLSDDYNSFLRLNRQMQVQVIMNVLDPLILYRRQMFWLFW